MFQTEVVEKIKTHFILSNYPPPAPPEIMPCVVEPDTPQMTIAIRRWEDAICMPDKEGNTDTHTRGQNA